jgi:hypothetical protein
MLFSLIVTKVRPCGGSLKGDKNNGDESFEEAIYKKIGLCIMEIDRLNVSCLSLREP